jgi:hypothetical protein
MMQLLWYRPFCVPDLNTGTSSTKQVLRRALNIAEKEGDGAAMDSIKDQLRLAISSAPREGVALSLRGKKPLLLQPPPITLALDHPSSTHSQETGLVEASGAQDLAGFDGGTGGWELAKLGGGGLVLRAPDPVQRQCVVYQRPAVHPRKSDLDPEVLKRRKREENVQVMGLFLVFCFLEDRT